MYILIRIPQSRANFFIAFENDGRHSRNRRFTMPILGIRFHINSKRRAYTIYTKLAAATDASDGAEFYDARPEVRNAVDRFSPTGRENARRSQYPFAPLSRISRVFSPSHHPYISIRCLSTSIANTHSWDAFNCAANKQRLISSTDAVAYIPIYAYFKGCDNL